MNIPSPHSSVSLFAVLAVSLGAARCEETAAFSPEPPRIVGEIADGTPPPPVPPRPDITKDCRVLKETTRHRDGRTVTIQKIEPPPLPPHKPSPAPPDLSDPEVRVRIAEAQAEAAKIVSRDILPLSVTVYDHELTFLRWVWRDPETGEAHGYAAWSEIDFNHFSGVGEIEYGPADARRRCGLIMGIGNIDTARAARNPALRAQIPDLQAARDALLKERPRPAGPVSPTTDDHSANPPVFAIVEGDSSNTEATALLRALHDIHACEKDRLAAAYEGRELARKEREAYLEAHPPKPEDITVRYWRKPKK